MAMSENSVKILNYLKENHGKNMTSADVAEALDLAKATVNGAFTAMQKKGLGARVDAEIPSFFILFSFSRGYFFSFLWLALNFYFGKKSMFCFLINQE